MSTRDEGAISLSFLLCDIEGSTGLVQAAGSVYAEILADERRIVRESVLHHNGTVIDAHGDELFAIFESASDAAAASVSAQLALIEHDWPGGYDVRVRMGLHSGEAILTEDGYTGIDVHRTARIGLAGHGWQILASAATRALAPDVAMRDLGSHRLAGLPSRSTSTRCWHRVFHATSRRFETRSPSSGTP